MQQSAGTLLYRRTARGVEVLLVHHAGWYNRRQPWGIPKGLAEEGEELEAAARRETREETGIVPEALAYLGSIRYKSVKKEVHCFAGKAPEDAVLHIDAKEIDAAKFVSLAEAQRIIHPAQRPFVEKLREHLER